MSPEILASMTQKQTFIAHGEAFTPFLAVYDEAEFLRGKAVLWLIDNMGVLSCFCKGSSVAADISCIIHASLL